MRMKINKQILRNLPDDLPVEKTHLLLYYIKSKYSVDAGIIFDKGELFIETYSGYQKLDDGTLQPKVVSPPFTAEELEQNFVREWKTYLQKLLDESQNMEE